METSSRVARGAILKRFSSDNKGGVAMIFALTMLPVLGMAGAAMDYTAASNMRAQMAQASDAAALAAARAPVTTVAERQKIAQDVFNANMGGKSVQNLSVKVKEIPSGIRVDATGQVKTQFVGMMGFDTMDVGVFSEVVRGEGFVEVALALDVTGSMKNDMDAMKKASVNFVNTLFAAGAAADSLRVGIVPYVASVNPGRTNLGMSAIDVTAQGPHHAQMLRWRWIGYMKNCDPMWGGGGGGGGGGDDGPGNGGDGAWLIEDGLNKLASIGRELFGVKPAAALGETPNTKAPLTGKEVTPGKPWVNDGSKAFLPTGFGHAHPCFLANPERINHLDLFDRIPDAQWAGCVEARPEPFDVNDSPPTPGNANSLFVPYFWPDEEGKRGEKTWAANNYMNDTPLPSGWTFDWDGAWEKTFSILKYNGANVADMNDQLGPNKSCPVELSRLTTDKTALLNKINSLKAVPGGGTISSEGVAWAWRVLSPNAPFSDGKSYGAAKKFLVLMSDGQNSIGENNKWGPVMSQYTAYGYLRDGRFGKNNFQTANKFLDDRFSLVCENAKKAGVTVMTVYFRDDNNSAKNMMKNCATSGKFFYEAVDAKSLDSAFQQIASEIGKIRISK